VATFEVLCSGEAKFEARGWPFRSIAIKSEPFLFYSMEIYFSVGAMISASIGAASDMRFMRIPNWLTYGSLVCGLALRVCLAGWHGLAQGLTGALLGGGIFFLMFLVRGMGAGDVKLMAAVSAWVGIHSTPRVLIATAIAGGILAVFYIIFYKQVVKTFRNMGELLRFHLVSGIQPHPELEAVAPSSIQVPYGLAIAVGTFYLLITTSSISGVIYGR
jgi:prepilin peptidase CpaA